jgi:hypothetical protein
MDHLILHRVDHVESLGDVGAVLADEVLGCRHEAWLPLRQVLIGLSGSATSRLGSERGSHISEIRLRSGEPWVVFRKSQKIPVAKDRFTNALNDLSAERSTRRCMGYGAALLACAVPLVCWQVPTIPALPPASHLLEILQRDDWSLVDVGHTFSPV